MREMIQTVIHKCVLLHQLAAAATREESHRKLSFICNVGGEKSESYIKSEERGRVIFIVAISLSHTVMMALWPRKREIKKMGTNKL